MSHDYFWWHASATVIEVEVFGVNSLTYIGRLTHVAKYDGITPATVLSKFNKMHGTSYTRVYSAGALRYEDVTNFSMLPLTEHGDDRVLFVTPSMSKLLGSRPTYARDVEQEERIR